MPSLSTFTIRGVPLLGMWLFAGPGAGAQDTVTTDIKGFVDLRAGLSSSRVGWRDGGLGKTAFGAGRDGDRRAIGRLEATAVATVPLGWDWTGFANFSFEDQGRAAVDIVEAFVRYKPAPAGRFGASARAGFFFAPVSFENTGLGWTSPYTISSAAINTWVGEELRTLGAEATGHYAHDGARASVSVGVFAMNDPAGSLLAWRGWAVGDVRAGLSERIPLSALRSLAPGGTAELQARWVEPFHEIDDRPGWYVSLRHEGDIGTLGAVAYDNRARDTAFDGDQYAWRTRFLAVGGTVATGGDVDIITQAMIGETTMATRPAPLGSVVSMSFGSAFVLVGKSWSRHRAAIRAEHFETHDRDLSPDDNNGERGKALTVAYTYFATPMQRITVEALVVASRRPERRFQGVTERVRETQVQASWRLFF